MTHVKESTTRLQAVGSETVVLDDAHVTYRVYLDRRPTVRQMVAQRAVTRRYREIPAVRGISLTAREGEAIGVIGRNGSGKSTLMQTMAGLLPPTKGAVYARSQPVILGVGAALQGSVSGRHNIILGGLALGMTHKELSEKLDDIIDFSGLRDAIDLPMRTYSSGMKGRLHFAIATAQEPDILLIDEALAVGDEDFRKRADERIRELRENAGTVFIVSHNLKQVRETCTRALWLEEGRLMKDADPGTVAKEYKRYVQS